MMDRAYHGVFCFTQYRAGQRRYDDDRSLWHECSFVITTDNDTHYVTTNGYTPKKAFQKIKRVFKQLKNINHEIDMIDYIDPDHYQEDIRDTLISNRTVHYPFTKNGITVPRRYYSIEDVS